MRKPLLALVLTIAGVAGGEGAADAATLYVNQSDPKAYDAIFFPSFVDNPCLDPNVPCRTIVHAEDRADDGPGNTVVVLPDPGGQTDVYDGPVEVGDGATRVDLVGAGRGDGGTLIRAASGQVVRLDGDSYASDLAVSLTGAGGTALVGVGPGSVAERVAADAPAGQALAIFGSGRDLLVTAKYGGAVYGTLRRATVTATDVGLDVSHDLPDAARLFDTTILASGPAPVGLRVQATGTGQAGDVRHVTVAGFDRAAVAEGTALPAKLRAVNSVFAGGSVADLAVVGTKATAELERTVDRSEAFFGGADPAQIVKVDGIDVDPGLDAGGHLTAGSALIDRGTAGGVLAGAPEDAVDVDGQARLQGGAVDVGADEVVPAGGGSGGAAGGGGGGGTAGATAGASVAGPDLAPVLSRLRITPKRLRAGRRPRVSFALSEPASVTITVAKRVSASRRRARLAKRRRRLVPLSGAQSVEAGAGSGSVRLAPRLRRGSYAVTAIATDAGGNRSAPVTASLRVVARAAVRRRD
jgi:hypothetical protein